MQGRLTITLEVPEPIGSFPVGVDLNVTNPIVATDIKNRTFFINGLSQRILSKKLRKVKSRLQTKLATKKAKGKNTHSIVRTLKRLSCKQRNRTKTYARTVAKRFVKWLEPNSIIVFEDLRIPKALKKDKMRKGTRRKLNQWYQMLLRDSIIHQAELNGYAYDYTDPFLTSQKCNICGQLGYRFGHYFTCSCGNKEHADVNASKNIRNQFAVLRSSGLKSPSPEAFNSTCTI